MLKMLLAASALTLPALTTPAAAQSMAGMNMPGMAMPVKNPAVKKAVPKKAVPKKKIAATKKPATTKPVVAKPVMVAKPVEPMPAMVMPEGSTMDHGAMDHATPPTAGAAPVDHSAMPGMAMPAPGDQSAIPEAEHGAMSGMVHAMPGALGAYPATREASGTAWQPDASQHQGLMKQAGPWMLMAHSTINLVADSQGSPRGDDKLFVSGMVMGMAQRPLGKGMLQFKVMLSPDPLMGKAGYPLLLASGETADGVNRLVDRQHPHDLFMELSASVSQPIGKGASVFLYGGLPGEPAFGPPAFMHREAILDSPEAPITHHWLDSTHISFGVLTAGLVVGRAKVEVSRFNAREPDQYRYNIETGPLDSTAVRVSWNPTRTLALQGSWAKFKDAEQLEPGVDQKRLSASMLFADEVALGYKLATTLAWGRKTIDGESDDAFAAEASVKHQGWTLFGRGEVTQNRELVAAVEHGPAYTVGKASLGLIRDVRAAEHVSVGIGGLVSVNFVPGALAAAYGGRHPTGAMGFLRFRLE